MKNVVDTPHEHAARPNVPPPERDDARAKNAPAFAPQVAPEKGNWFHRNRWFTKEPISYAGYQFFRSTLATIPYGLGMAFFHHMFGLMSVKGREMGLTQAGEKAYVQAATKILPNGMPGGIGVALEVVDKVGGGAMHTSGVKGVMGRNMIRLANSPLNAALQIGLAFSMFRFTGGLVKGVRDKVMDEKNTPDDTARESRNWLQNVGEMMKVNWKAEAIGTFWAALTLGFIGHNFKQSTPYAKQAGETLVGAWKRVWSKPSKLLQNSALWAVSYATFFEVDERIQKDVKLRQGTWNGHTSSLNNGPSSITGEPPSPENGRVNGQDDDKTPHGFFTHDPGLPRLLIRRLLPTAVGITGYAVMKRAGYVLGGGQMETITKEMAHSGFGKNLQQFGKNAYREGLATATFGVLWMATDAWGSWFDKFFEDRNPHKAPDRPLNGHQSHKMAELHDQLAAKERGHAA